MPLANRLLDLIKLMEEWEESVRRGREVSPDELCKECPELLELLRSQILARKEDPGSIRPFDSQSRATLANLVARIQLLPRSDWLSALRETQRRLWQDRVPLLAESILGLFPDLDSEEAQVLIGGEFVLRRELGHSASLVEFQRRFPHFSKELALVLALLETNSFPEDASTQDPPVQAVRVGSVFANQAIAQAAALVDPHPGAEPIPGFRLVRLLGEGGFGSVWLAQTPGQFHVALKFVVLSGTIGFHEKRSLEILRHLRHPNLLTIFGAWKNDRFLIIAMELADRTLADRHKEAKSAGLQGIPRDELLGYMKAAAEAIDYLNEPHTLDEKQVAVRVQHRDIKPANILLVGSGVKVADFGLARVLNQTMVSHTGGMTPAYAAPEFLQGRTSQHSDQYCLAVAYCELRGGRLPFTGAFADLILGHVEKEPDLSMLPAEERAAAARALAKNPNSRWPSCKSFIDALLAAKPGTLEDQAAGQGPMPKPPSGLLATTLYPLTPPPAPAPDRSRSRSRTPWVAAIVVLLAVAGSLIGLKWNELLDRLAPLENGSTGLIAQGNSPSLPDVQAASKSVSPPTSLWTAQPVVESPSLAPMPRKSRQGPVEPPVKTLAKAVEPEPKMSIPTPPMKTPEPEPKTSIPALVVTPLPMPEPMVPKPTPVDPPKSVASEKVGKRLVFRDHGSADIRCVALVPKTSQVISGDHSGKLWQWDAATGKSIRSLPAHGKSVFSLAVDGDGRSVVSGGENAVIQLVDLNAPQEPTVLRSTKTDNGDMEVYGLGFLSKQRFVAAGNANWILAWERGSPDPQRLQTTLEEVLCLSSDGDRRIVIGGSRGALRSREVEATSEEVPYRGHLDDVRAVAFFPDGKRFVSGGGGDGPDKGQQDFAVRIWKLGEQDAKIVFKQHGSPVECVAVSPDGTRVLSGDRGGNLYLWNAETGVEDTRLTPAREINDGSGSINCIVFSQDGREAILGRQDGTLQVWTLPGDRK